MNTRITATQYIAADIRACEACWDCIEKCKGNALGKINLWFHKHVTMKNPENCRGCGICVKVCPNHVFELIPRKTVVV